MDSRFFHAKRPWSRYKDFLLQSYLEPYIPKVATLNRPILLVDCFAGRGRFEDGEPGSPLIIAEAIRKWRDRGTNITGQFIEAHPENFAALNNVLNPHSDYCRPMHGSFDEHLPELAQRARQNTVFLYVDPYTVKGLVFERMQRVYEHIHRSSSSVEILLNFNAAIFMRWALAALQRHSTIPAEIDDVEALADDPGESVEKAVLSGIAGGDYWTQIVSDDQLTFPEKLTAFVAEYIQRMLGSFRFVCTYWVKEKYHHQVPKYILIFATRNVHGVELMNDIMCQARRNFVAGHFSENRLFDCTPDEEVVDPARLYEDIVAVLNHADRPMTRMDLRVDLLLRGYFAKLLRSEINQAVGELLKEGRLFSSTGKARINDKVSLSNRPFGKSA